jgi:uracil-DNA glycosylase
MPEPTDPRAALARQLRLHLESLKAGGIEFLPRAAPLTFAPIAGEPRDMSSPEVPGLPPGDSPSLARFESDSDARRHELTVLAGHVSTCDRCEALFSTRQNTVFGVGLVDPDICFVGEAPGADEDASGEPFVGKAGQLLNKIIAAMGFQREQVYICNTIKCRPPNNRVPTPEERSNCREYFEQQIAMVRPKYIICLGATAAQSVLGTTLGIGKLRGRMHRFQDIPVICTFHPAALLRNESWKKDTWDDMKLLLRTMGRPIPGTKSG